MTAQKTPLARALILAAAAWLAHVVATVCVISVMTLAVSRCVETYEQQDLTPPYLTMMVVDWSDLFIDYWYLAALPLAIDGLLLFVLNRAPENWQWLARGWSAAVLLLACVWLAITALAIALPFGELDRAPHEGHIVHAIFQPKPSEVHCDDTSLRHAAGREPVRC